MTDFEEYQTKTEETAIGFTRTDNDKRPQWWDDEEEVYRRMCLLFLASAINGEAGEFAEKMKKYVREDDEKYLREAEDELGDILWYFARACEALDTEMGDVAEENLDKLFGRKERDAITGQGDNR